MNIGDKIKKTGGDYTFEGVIVSKFQKLSGVTRVVAENREGLCHIFNENQLEVTGQTAPPKLEKLDVFIPPAIRLMETVQTARHNSTPPS
jgi:hypothetical protein